MIKNYTRKLLCLLLSAYMVFSILSPTIEAQAATGDTAIGDVSINSANEITVFFRTGDPAAVYAVIPFPKFPKGAKITNLKSSNPRIAIVNYSSYFNNISIKAKKPGITYLSFKMKWQGKLKNFKYKVTTKKAVNPCVSFKLGNKDYVRKFNNQRNVDVRLANNKKMKLRIKTRPGWTIQRIMKRVDSSATDIKNNSTVSFKKSILKGIIVVFQHEATNRMDILSLNVEEL